MEQVCMNTIWILNFSKDKLVGPFMLMLLVLIHTESVVRSNLPYQGILISHFCYLHCSCFKGPRLLCAKMWKYATTCEQL